MLYVFIFMSVDVQKVRLSSQSGLNLLPSLNVLPSLSRHLTPECVVVVVVIVVYRCQANILRTFFITFK